MNAESMKAGWDLALPAMTKFVLMALLYAADENGDCCVTRKWIAKKCGLLPKTVDRHIAQLANTGFLTKELQFDENGANIENLYHVRVSDFDVSDDDLPF
jgi:hypothetical protein